MGRRTLWGTGAILVASLGLYGVIASADPAAPPDSVSPIKHVVVIFGENQSFDHYFGTYPTAKNPPGQPNFTGTLNGQNVDGLPPALMSPNNPNSQQPRRLDRSEA